MVVRRTSSPIVVDVPRINDVIANRNKRRIKRTELPTWWGLFMGGCGILLLLYIAWGLISSKPDEPATSTETVAPYEIVTVPPVNQTQTTSNSQPNETTPQTEPVTTATTSEPQAATTTAPATTPGGQDSATQLPTAGGGVTTIPTGAFNAISATATTTGGADSTIIEIVWRAADGPYIYLDVTLDPDGNGAAAPTVLHYRTYQISNSWAVEPA